MSKREKEKGLAEKGNSFWKEFKAFALKGNMIDMAIGIIIGGAFSSIVNSLVNDVIMPVLSVFTGKIDFNSLFVALDGNHYPNLQAAADANAATINYGAFISGVINFLIMALVVFVVMKQLQRFHKEPAPAAPTQKVCPYCKTKIDMEAVRCPHCTSILDKEAFGDEGIIN